MRPWIAVGLLLLAAIVAGAVWWLVRLLHPEELVRRRQEQHWHALQAELAYLERLDQFLSTGQASRSHASVFLSHSLVDQMLAAGDGARVPLPRIPGGTLLIRSVRANFRNGFPGLRVQARAEQAGESFGLEVEANAVLLIEPDGEDLQLRVLLEDLTPKLDWQILRGPVRALADALIEARALDIVQGLPVVRVPLRNDLPIAFDALREPVTVKLESGTLEGVMEGPAMRLSRRVWVDRLLTLSDGIHVYLSLDQRGTLPPPPRESAPLPDPLAPAIDRDERQLASLRAQLDDRVRPMLISDSDIRLWTGRGLLEAVTRAFNDLPEAVRQMRFRVTGQTGTLRQSETGGLGCGYTARLDGNSAEADIRVADLQTSWSADDTILVNSRHSVDFRGRVAAQVKGPAGFCRTTTTVFGAKLPGFDFKGGRKCSCSPSDGAATTAPVRAAESGAWNASIRIAGDAQHWLRYEMRVVSPREIPVRVALDVRLLGKIELPLRVPLPAQTISGHAPPWFERSGTVDAGMAGLSRRYRLAVRPRAVQADSTGVAAAGSATVEWQ